MTGTGPRAEGALLDEDDPPPAYAERLFVPVWWWVAPPLVALPLLLTALVPGAGGGLLDGRTGTRVVALLVGVLLLLAVAAGLALASRTPVLVAGGRLVAGPRRLDVRRVTGVTTLDRAGVRRALGPAGDHHAYRVTRPWVRTAVYVTAADEPGWLVSTRHPELLADAVALARAGTTR